MSVHRCRIVLVNIFVLSVSLLQLSCAALGTKVRVEHPESIAAIKRVAVWPAAAIPIEKKFRMLSAYALSDYDFRVYCTLLSRIADSCLYNELHTLTPFDLIGPDSTTTLVRLQDPTFDRYTGMLWTNFGNLTFADAILVTDYAFAGEGYSGVNTYVTMSLYDRPTGNLVMKVTFNTKWGKSYLLEKGPDTTMPDAIHGATVALGKTFAHHKE